MGSRDEKTGNEETAENGRILIWKKIIAGGQRIVFSIDCGSQFHVMDFQNRKGAL